MSGGVLHLCNSSKLGVQFVSLNTINKKILHVSNSSTRWLSTYSRRLLQKQADTSIKPEIKGIPYKQIKIGVPKETWQNEKRVALSPAVAATLVKKGFNVNVEENAGLDAKFRNEDYKDAGANIVKTNEAFSSGNFDC